MTQEPKSAEVGPAWVGRLTVVVIVLFVAIVLLLFFFAARGPR